MSYKIEISYRTGGSLHTEDTTVVLELEWNDLDVAKANLKRIKDHYQMYQELKSYSVRKQKTAQEIFAENSDKDWFVAMKKDALFSEGKFVRVIDPKEKKWWSGKGYSIDQIYDEFYGENCLNIFTDSGNKMQMTAFWIGHFEQLYGAKIIVAVDEELEFAV